MPQKFSDGHGCEKNNRDRTDFLCERQNFNFLVMIVGEKSLDDTRGYPIPRSFLSSSYGIHTRAIALVQW